MNSDSSTTTNSPELIRGRIIEKVIILMIIVAFLLISA
jgi:cell division protein FtsL